MLVALGGILGTVIRWAVLDAADDALWSLLTVNTVGAFLLGVIVRGFFHSGARLRLFVGVGFCGALTTFSTLALAIAQRLDEGRILDATAVAGSNVGLGLGAAVLGASTRRWVAR
jgi:fluoride exporter